MTLRIAIPSKLCLKLSRCIPIPLLFSSDSFATHSLITYLKHNLHSLTSTSRGRRPNRQQNQKEKCYAKFTDGFWQNPFK